MLFEHSYNLNIEVYINSGWHDAGIKIPKRAIDETNSIIENPEQENGGSIANQAWDPE